MKLVARTGHPDFLDLPWDQPLADWDHERLVEIPRGLHRHVVRFAEYDEGLYVLKELPRRFAEREYELLQFLAEERVPCVEAVGVVTRRRDADGGELSAVFISAHLEHALPYRLLFARRHARDLRDPMMDALVDLLVRLHLVGFLWLDCSLSNTLFRRDAGRLAAYVVDVETGERHDELTDGQRQHDLETAIERCGGELLDLQASGTVDPDVDPAALADELRGRYARLWEELTREEVVTVDQRHLINQRLRRINELGYDVGELELVGDDEGRTMRLRLHVVEPARHERLLRERTGIHAEPAQARRLLNDIASFGAWLSTIVDDPTPDEVDAEWLRTSWQGAMERIPRELRQRRVPAELFVEALDHWHALQADGKDVEFFDAVRDYADNVLPAADDERVVGVTLPF